jgi:hypothetical protein
MLIERIVEEVKHLVIIPKEFERDDDRKTDSAIVYKEILVDAKLKIGKKVESRADKERFIKEVKARV